MYFRTTYNFRDHIGKISNRSKNIHRSYKIQFKFYLLYRIFMCFIRSVPNSTNVITIITSDHNIMLIKFQKV